MRSTLFDRSARRHRHGTTKALVPTDPDRCPACGSAIEVRTWAEPTLFRHGGHGATRETILAYCTKPKCHWGMIRKVTEVKP